MTTIEAISSEPVESVAELIDLQQQLESNDSINHGGRYVGRWAFRGQPRLFGTLAPSFQRQFSRRSFGAAEIIENQLIRAFREHYEKLNDRSADMPVPVRISDGFDLRCLSVMQHYEIPTRLLDWTADLWTALYFACASEPGQDAELWYYDRGIFSAQSADKKLATLLDGSDTPPVEPSILEDHRDDDLLLELDPRITPRMKEQLAHHTVSTNVFADHAPLLLALQETHAPDDPDPHIRRVVIKASAKGNALQFLAEHRDITASTVFPDVVGLGRFLRWQFESLRTMLL